MKRIEREITALVNKMMNVQEELNELKSELENKIWEIENKEEDCEVAEKKIIRLEDDIKYIDDVNEALNTAISEIEYYIEY